MDLLTALFIGGGALVFGALLGYFFRWLITLGQKGSIELTVKQTILEAKDQAQKIVDRAENQAEEILKEIKLKERETEQQLKKREDRLLKKDEVLDRRQNDLDQELENLKQQLIELQKTKDRLAEQAKQQKIELERVAGLSVEAAREEMMKRLLAEEEETLANRLRKFEQGSQERLENRARTILTSIIQRLASPTTQELTATTVTIPSDDLKGKIIGKEGRNIRALEKETGVEVVIDDTPGSIILSSFDPVRREIARQALEELIADGRIHPAKIEETVARAKENVSRKIKERGEQAAYEANVFNLDPRIIIILGRLHFRTSYGQNVLQHSIEVANLAGMLAEELGANVSVARAGALLHDIGKAVDHEVPGTHVEIGRRILKKFGVSEEIIKAMQAHHEEYPYETLESIIVQTADAISGGRPGARRDSVENYLKRLKELEETASAFPGVEKVYAIQAGREVRVFVEPQKIGDLEARRLARDVAKKIEDELKYPGEIKVVVIRESRVIEYAR